MLQLERLRTLWRKEVDFPKSLLRVICNLLLQELTEKRDSVFCRGKVVTVNFWSATSRQIRYFSPLCTSFSGVRSVRVWHNWHINFSPMKIKRLKRYFVHSHSEKSSCIKKRVPINMLSHKMCIGLQNYTSLTSQYFLFKKIISTVDKI